jgi:hypothetical protein
MSRVEELSKAILTDLLADFSDRALTANDLSNGYVGVTLSAIRQKCCAEASAPSVDFDLALKELEEGELIQTGPMVPFDNLPIHRSLSLAAVVNTSTRI